MTLTEFLLARIAEDEAVVTPPEWYCTGSARGEGWGSRGDCQLCDKYMFDGTESVTKDAYREHMEDEHNARRVLRECDAKRQIVEWCSDEPANQWEVGPILRTLAIVYSDHPDYRAEWKP